MPAAAKLTTERNNADNVENKPGRPNPLDGDEFVGMGTDPVCGEDDVVLIH